MTSPWGHWSPLPDEVQFSDPTLSELLDGGQAFRWWRQASESFIGQWSDQLVELRLGFTDRQAEALRDLPVRTDPHLATCMAAFPGLRILRQPFGETLLGFLCSATKQIVQIKQMLALLADRHGAPVTRNHNGYQQLPTWAELAELSEEQLRGCQLGFRAKYIKGTAALLAANPGWEEAVTQMAYPEAKAALCALPGVGEKIADCVALFGLGHLEAFPVDTWMIKSMARRYGLAGWSPSQVAHFGRTHFGTTAGLAQQYLFAWERAHGR